tara:strand:+ start:984 stop:1856 length:873 start_codon:yes stop_codon:yes gene_type:complete
MKKNSVIAIYLPNGKNFINQFYGLYYSVVFKTDLHKKFDFLISGPESLREKLPSEHCHFIATEDLSSDPNLCYRYSGNSYGYVNSFIPFVNEKCKELLLNYEYCLRLDVDTFVCPGLNDIQCEKNEIVVGNAAYSSETARIRLPEIMKKLNLEDQNIHNVGSTWYSTTKNMIECGEKTIKYVEYFLENHFSEHEGSWPQWYAGVILLYAGHLAINSSGLNITKTDKLDYYSTSNNEVSEYYTLHCWHTDTFFSKHWFMNNRYKDREPISDSLKCNEYSYDCITKGVGKLS